MRTTRVLTIAIGLTVPGAALAGDVNTACHVQTLCVGLVPGPGAVTECLRAHKAELSSDCKIALADRMLNGHAKAQPAQAPGPAAPSPAPGPGPAAAPPSH
jgi:hypothetical protein